MHLEQGSCLELPFNFKATITKDYGGSFFRLWCHTIDSILSYLKWMKIYVHISFNPIGLFTTRYKMITHKITLQK